MHSGTERTITSVNRSMALNAEYQSIKIDVKKTDEETQNVISNTYGKYIKNNLEVFWNTIGLDPNVNIAYQNTMLDPNQAIEARGRTFYPHPGVGYIRGGEGLGAFSTYLVG